MVSLEICDKFVAKIPLPKMPGLHNILSFLIEFLDMIVYILTKFL